MEGGITLAIETSCDETAVALADAEGRILVSEVASQIAIHAPYGGVVPELASRNHNADLRPIVQHAVAKSGLDWAQIDAMAATSGPGLASSLLIGDTTAKAMAAAKGCPFYSINHMEGHLLSPFIGGGTEIPPHTALIVSGGHTLLVRVRGVGDYSLLGSTKDDAAGEAFDKVGKMIGLPYPGGPEIAKRAELGNPRAYDFPRSMIDSGDFEFSFSGLKTAVLYQLQKLGDSPSDEVIQDLCASFQAAVVDVLVKKLFLAAEADSSTLVTVSGGVSCNALLRNSIETEAKIRGIRALLARPDFSTDNAAMIAYAAVLRRREGIPGSSLQSDINPNLPLAGRVQ
jgi:N6-L-threonylcarbamoyladenine synthase